MPAPDLVHRADPSARSAGWWTAGASALLFLVLGLFRNDRASMWLDEVMSIATVTSSLQDKIVFFLGLPEQHPLYYLFLDPWVRIFGPSESSARALSAVFGALTVVALYRFGRRVLGPGIAGVATALMAVAPFWIYYAQEARMYTLVGLMAVLLADSYSRWAETGFAGRPTRLILVAIAAAYTHLFFVFVLVSLFLHAAWTRARTVSWGTILKPFVITAVVYLPMAYLLLRRMSVVAHPWVGWQHVVFGIPYTLLRFSIGYSEVLANVNWKVEIVDLLVQDAPLLAVAAVVYGLCFLKGIGALARRGAQGKLVLLLVLGPALMTLLLAPITIMTSERYLLVSFPFFVLTIATGVAALEGRLRAGAVVGLVALTLWILPGYYTKADFGKEQWRDVAQLVESEGRDGDVVVFIVPIQEEPFRYYLPDPDPVELVGLDDLPSPDDPRRVWLIVSHVPMDERVAIVEEVTRDRTVYERTDFDLEAGISVLLLGPGSPTTSPARSS